ncbi:MAG: YHS domain-containing protein [Chloroflexota bacterium]
MHEPIVCGMHEDVVCGKSIDASTTAWASRYHGEPYFFCSLECRERFELEPEDYLVVPTAEPVQTAVLLRIVS